MFFIGVIIGVFIGVTFGIGLYALVLAGKDIE